MLPNNLIRKNHLNNVTVKRTEQHTYTSVLTKMQSYCAYQERCTQEVYQKLQQFDISDHDREKIIHSLNSDGYLDDLRFARIFAGSKFRLKKWGKIKIKFELNTRKIQDDFIREALQEIFEEDYLETINILISNKLKELQGEETLIIREKTIKYLLSKGFELDLVHQNLTRHLNKLT